MKLKYLVRIVKCFSSIESQTITNQVERVRVRVLQLRNKTVQNEVRKKRRYLDG